MKKITNYFFATILLLSYTGRAGNPSKTGGAVDTTNPGFKWKGNKECEFNSFSLNTVFNLPIVRFNVNSLDGTKESLGSLEYFNSVGAGVAFSWGKVSMKTDEPDLLNTLERERTVEMKNIIGLSFGVLFSKSDSIGGSRLIFTPNVCLQILDFQVGYGYELGTVTNPYHRSVLTLTYGIPLTKFTDAGSFLFPRKIKREGQSATMQGFF